MNGGGSDSGSDRDVSTNSDLIDPSLKEKLALLSDLQAPLDDGGFDEDEGNVLTRLKDRIDDARDALSENETFSRLATASQKVGNVANAAWAFSKKAAWIVGTTALIIVVPLLYEMDKELNLGASQDAAEQSQAPGNSETGSPDTGKDASTKTPS